MEATVFFTAAVLTITSVCASGGVSEEWNYDRNSNLGPADWHLAYPACGRTMQSPIDIQRHQSLPDPGLKAFDFRDYRLGASDRVRMRLLNVGGHTVEVKYSGQPVYLRGGSLPEDYQLDQFHFHWGETDERGSEHALDGHHFPMELHLVHHAASLPGDQAAQRPYGLAVIAYFIEVGRHNDAFDDLLYFFRYVDLPDSQVDIPSFPLISLLPPGSEYHYYRYMGSLTTPPCYESVIWSISQSTIEISEEQLNQFRSLHRDDSHYLVDDFRPLQALNDRTITSTT